jgi:hypothetical protein
MAGVNCLFWLAIPVFPLRPLCLALLMCSDEKQCESRDKTQAGGLTKWNWKNLVNIHAVQHVQEKKKLALPLTHITEKRAMFWEETQVPQINFSNIDES